MRIVLHTSVGQDHEIVVAKTSKYCIRCLRYSHGKLKWTRDIEPGEPYVSIWVKPDEETLRLSREGDSEARKAVRTSKIRSLHHHLDCYREIYGIDIYAIDMLISEFETEITDPINKRKYKRTSKILATLKEVREKLKKDELSDSVSDELAQSILAEELLNPSGKLI